MTPDNYDSARPRGTDPSAPGEPIPEPQPRTFIEFLSFYVRTVAQARGDPDRVKQTRELLVDPARLVINRLFVIALVALLVLAALALSATRIDLGPVSKQPVPGGWVVGGSGVAVVALMLLLRRRGRGRAATNRRRTDYIDYSGSALINATNRRVPPQRPKVDSTAENLDYPSADGAHDAIADQTRHADDHYDTKNL
ncbi:hypothetical protein ACWEOZ_15315 [Actinoplanes sp. NPDC004185]